MMITFSYFLKHKIHLTQETFDWAHVFGLYLIEIYFPYTSKQLLCPQKPIHQIAMQQSRALEYTSTRLNLNTQHLCSLQ